MPTTQEIQDWKGQTLNGPDGKIGKIDEIYLDDQTGEPEWALVNTGLFGTRSSFVPIADARADGGAITVPFDKDTVKGAPSSSATTVAATRTRRRRRRPAATPRTATSPSATRRTGARPTATRWATTPRAAPRTTR
jgi:hypothetical protein